MSQIIQSWSIQNLLLTLGARISGASGGYRHFASAGNATLIAYGGTNGGKIAFCNNSSGGTASIYLADNGGLELYLNNHTGGLTISNPDLAGDIIGILLGTSGARRLKPILLIFGVSRKFNALVTRMNAGYSRAPTTKTLELQAGFTLACSFSSSAETLLRQ